MIPRPRRMANAKDGATGSRLVTGDVRGGEYGSTGGRPGRPEGDGPARVFGGPGRPAVPAGRSVGLRTCRRRLACVAVAGGGPPGTVSPTFCARGYAGHLVGPAVPAGRGAGLSLRRPELACVAVAGGGPPGTVSPTFCARGRAGQPAAAGHLVGPAVLGGPRRRLEPWRSRRLGGWFPASA